MLITGVVMNEINPLYVQEVQKLVESSPFPQHMSMQLAAMDLDRATIELVLGEVHLQPFGIVHGGVFATLIDTATFWAAFMRIPEDAGLVNIDLKLNYLKSATNGLLKAEGRSIRNGKSISYSEASVYGGSGELLAHGTSTLMVLENKGLKTHHKKFLPSHV